jgi:short-subunit dehydrogenase
MILIMIYIINEEFPMQTPVPTVLITGASTGIGAVYADRFAHRGHNLVLVARDQGRLDTLATGLRSETGVNVDVLRADLTDPADVERVAARLRSDDRIGILVNNAGAVAEGGFAKPSAQDAQRIIQLNVTAVTLLSAAVVPRFLERGAGAIVNIASTVALAPEIPFGVYGATKSYVLAFSQNMQTELGPRGVYVQAVLPGATRTEIWERSGRDVNQLSAVMDAQEMVDAALVGFDRRELVTIPALADADQWTALETARKAILANVMKDRPAARYRASA